MTDLNIVQAYLGGMAFATFGAERISNHADATGLIRATALRLRIRAVAGQRRA